MTLKMPDYLSVPPAELGSVRPGTAPTSPALGTVPAQRLVILSLCGTVLGSWGGLSPSQITLPSFDVNVTEDET